MFELAGYETLDLIGGGGFGEVWLACQNSTGRNVAVKVAHAPISDETLQIRFEREYKALGRLSGHPNIVDIVTAGTLDDGRAYLVLEFIEGGTLWDKAQTERIPEERLLNVGLELAKALDTAHTAGVLHRDIKPENILLRESGEAVVSDFGLAHLRDGATTSPNAVVASVAYAAPEILRGEGATTATDIYGLGVCLLTAATQSVPFVELTDKSIQTVIKRVLTVEPLSITTIGYSELFGSLVSELLSKDASQRPNNAADLVRRFTELPDLQSERDFSWSDFLGAPEERILSTGEMPAISVRDDAASMSEHSPQQASDTKPTGDAPSTDRAGTDRSVEKKSATSSSAGSVPASTAPEGSSTPPNVPEAAAETPASEEDLDDVDQLIFELTNTGDTAGAPVEPAADEPAANLDGQPKAPTRDPAPDDSQTDEQSPATPQQAKPEPKTETSQSPATPQQAKPEPKTETSQSPATPQQAKPEPKTETSQPPATPQQAKPEPKTETEDPSTTRPQAEPSQAKTRLADLAAADLSDQGDEEAPPSPTKLPVNTPVSDATTEMAAISIESLAPMGKPSPKRPTEQEPTPKDVLSHIDQGARYPADKNPSPDNQTPEKTEQKKPPISTSEQSSPASEPSRTATSTKPQEPDSEGPPDTDSPLDRILIPAKDNEPTNAAETKPAAARTATPGGIQPPEREKAEGWAKRIVLGIAVFVGLLLAIWALRSISSPDSSNADSPRLGSGESSVALPLTIESADLPAGTIEATTPSQGPVAPLFCDQKPNADGLLGWKGSQLFTPENEASIEQLVVDFDKPKSAQSYADSIEGTTQCESWTLARQASIFTATTKEIEPGKTVGDKTLLFETTIQNASGDKTTTKTWLFVSDVDILVFSITAGDDDRLTELEPLAIQAGEKFVSPDEE